LRHGEGQYFSYSSTFTLESGEVIPFPFEYMGSWHLDKKHGKGLLILQGSSPNLQKTIEGEWENDLLKFERPVKLTVKENSTGKVISTFEGMIDQRYNPIIHN
jgi:hypothetical protein